MLFLVRQAVEKYDRWMHGLYLTHSQGGRRGKHQGVGRTCALITLLSFRDVLAVRRSGLLFLHFDAIPTCPPVMNLMVRVGIAYMYSIDCAKDTTNFSSSLLGAQSLCSLCVFYLIYNSKPGWSQHSECSFNEDKNRSWN